MVLYSLIKGTQKERNIRRAEILNIYNGSTYGIPDTEVQQAVECVG